MRVSKFLQRRAFQRGSTTAIRCRPYRTLLAGIALVLTISLAAFALPRREKDASQYGSGLILNVPFPEAEVSQVVQEIVQNGIIHGTKEYTKDQYLSGAAAASSTRLFSERTESGKVFYKIRLKALAPRNFKDSSDVGTLAVRYVVQAQDADHTVVRIDARFVEDFRHVSHPSNGSVESAEYKDIHDHLEQLEEMKAQGAEASRTQAAATTQPAAVTSPAPALKVEAASPLPVPPPVGATSTPASASAPEQSLEERVKDLRRQVQRIVKAPGAPLKSAPFHTANTLQSLPTGAEVLIVVSTPYWFGVETHEGRHGWVSRDELELLP